ncbi:MAG: preprotein translocase subunit Sec61beta [Candidatus Altiarchaeum hamiconexum]|nr:preprotein translocase subunit Sec61beta [Candidatus Altarchaeum hamiconexum]PJC13226.1 MAG: preprotein translocase subunit Sec61beta [Candidatus Altarchaeum sp. CG_4_9_14_0_8_um_filter_32_206]
MARSRKIGYEGPPGVAGLVRYFDVDEGGPKLEPMLIIGVIIVIIVVEVASGTLLKI